MELKNLAFKMKVDILKQFVLSKPCIYLFIHIFKPAQLFMESEGTQTEKQQNGLIAVTACKR